VKRAEHFRPNAANQGHFGRKKASKNKKGGSMGILLIIGIILLVLWLLGLFVFNLGTLIYIALVVGIIFIIVWLLKAVLKLF
jgi:hypothetical protein